MIVLPDPRPRANDGGVLRRLECRLCSCDEMCALALLRRKETTDA